MIVPYPGAAVTRQPDTGTQHVIPASLNTSSPGGATLRQYDSDGAVMYVISVLVVYSLSIFLLIVMLARRKPSSMDLDSQVTTYMKGLEYARKQHQQDQVLYARLKLPGNFVGMRCDNRPVTYMNNRYKTKVKTNQKYKKIGICLDPVYSESDFYSSVSKIDGCHGDHRSSYSSYRSRIRRQAPISWEESEEDDDESVQLLPAITAPRRDSIDEETTEHIKSNNDDGTGILQKNSFNNDIETKTKAVEQSKVSHDVGVQVDIPETRRHAETVKDERREYRGNSNINKDTKIHIVPGWSAGTTVLVSDV